VADRVRTADGRTLAVESWGEPDGHPVFLLHGTPGCRLGPRPRSGLLYRLGVRLIAFDRPGYGGSDRLAGRSVADVAADVATIADAYDIDCFAVVGRSGGGPHALACAALLTERITRVAVLVGLAPPSAEGLDWFAGMTTSNIVEYRAATQGPGVVGLMLTPAAEQIRTDPAQLLRALFAELTTSDRRVVADAGIRAMLLKNYAEAVRTSADGWIDDAVAFRGPWGFDPASIKVPALIWHGENDAFSPISHARWLADRIPGSTAVVEPGVAHFSALDVLPDVLTWLVSPPE
jgi:pimeloyl-ACP methyl ester carboxylesterase